MGIVYRDLKPENVLIQQNGHIMLVDFDLSLILAEKLNPEVQKLRTRKMKNQSRSLFACFSQKRDIFEPRDKNSSKERTFVSRVFPLEIYGRKKVLKRPSSTNLLSYSFVGTDEYLAPEILWRTGHGLAVDWWTFGVFLYEMAYGITPFKGGTRKETFFNILCREPVMSSPCIALNDLISKLLVKEPDERFGSVNGSAQIKGHEFFHGVQWDELEYICRPPFLPSLLSLEEIDKGDIGQEPVLVESAYDTLALQSTATNLETSHSLNDLKTSAGGLLESDLSGRHIESINTSQEEPHNLRKAGSFQRS
ncbi:hypothetical protein O6H91_17G045900 [Diphasiastrum complanatum]|nr:hypothetical protein O6H91_Y176800 [Diphasiastrum complanatum]KAJ7525328.1 hypothetical protein O6H91_17G045900 [Diphasiastrum complanatum]